MWGFKVWWARTKVEHTTGEQWRFSFHDARGIQQSYRLDWGPNVERVMLLCESTPAGEPAALIYEELSTHREMRDPPREGHLSGVDFIPPAQVPTLGRLARQVWDSYQRSKGA
jgi:hypothetical protein